METLIAGDSLRCFAEIGVLGKVWPKERVVAGMRVCRWLRETLLAHIDGVWLKVSPPPNGGVAEAQLAAEVAQSLRSFCAPPSCPPRVSAALQCSAGRNMALAVLDGIECALSTRGPQTMERERSAHHAQGQSREGGEEANEQGQNREAKAWLAVSHLDLRMTGLRGLDCAQLAATLQCCSGLTFLNLGCNGLSAAALAKGLGSCSGLTHLDLCSNSLKPADIRSLVQVLRNDLTNLEELNLSWNALGEAGSAHLSDALRTHPRLSHLSIVGTDCSPTLLASFLPSCPRLARLDMGHIRLSRGSPPSPSAGLQQLAAALPLCLRLERLSLQHCALHPAGAHLLALALPRCVRLRSLHLQENLIGAQGATSLARALSQCSTLTELDVGRNELDGEGGGVVCASLRRCALRRLNLADNELRAEGAEAVAGALGEAGRGLTDLDLADNGVGRQGALSLAGQLRHWTSLQSLRLSGNFLRAEGLKLLVSPLLECGELRYLDVSFNEIGRSHAPISHVRGSDPAGFPRRERGHR